MTLPPLWRNRIRHYAMLLRAPINVVQSKPYRDQLLLGLIYGEAAIKTKVKPPVAVTKSKTEGRLNLILESTAVAITIVFSDTKSAANSSGADNALELVCALANAGQVVRIITLDDPVSLPEFEFRKALMSRFGCQKDSQQRIEVWDAASRPAPCGKDDLFVAADASAARLLADAFIERDHVPSFYHLTSEDEPITEAWPGELWKVYQSACSRLSLKELGLDRIVERFVEAVSAERVAGCGAAPGSTFALQSTWGLGYRVLKPWTNETKVDRVCLFAHFDVGNRIDPYVLRYLRELKTCGEQIVFISSSDLAVEAFAAIEPMVVAAICRENLGLDFCGWATALEVFPQIHHAEQLILANDSVYGPIGHLGSILEQMRAAPYDVWGGVESLGIERHLQSWLLCFRRKAVRSETFRLFWESVMPLTNKLETIKQYEVPIFRIFVANGFEVGSVINSFSLNVGSANPMAHPWRRLLDLGLPFVKIELLRENPTAADIEGWIEDIADRGYPPHLILQHLRRVAGRAPPAFQTL